MSADTILPDLAKPSGHMETGCVLRAFAAHPKYRLSTEAKIAGEFLASRFFKRDTYSGRQDVSFWKKITYPYWVTDILSALDSLSFLGFTSENPNIKKGLSWFINKQEEKGGWSLYLLRGGKHKSVPFWVDLAICRVFKRFYEN